MKEAKEQALEMEWTEAPAFLRMASFLLCVLVSSSELSTNFYDKSCPGMEEKISHVIRHKMRAGQTITAPATLRLFFHDCFVQGCDGSVLISSTQSNKAERDADINLSLAGDSFDAVVRAKDILEETCPGVVSCADILAVLARDSSVAVSTPAVTLSTTFQAFEQTWDGRINVLAVKKNPSLSDRPSLIQYRDPSSEAITFLNQNIWMKGPSWAVQKGRRDSRTSMAALAGAELPTSSANLTQLINQFASKGLTPLDLVALAGAHTAGSAHCTEFMERLRRSDPTMDPRFRAFLLLSCPLSLTDEEVVVTFDGTPFVFDNLFYRSVTERKALLTSDQTLLSGDDVVRRAVFRFAENETLFFQEFAAAMQKFGSVGVLSGAQGEVRKDCTKLN